MIGLRRAATLVALGLLLCASVSRAHIAVAERSLHSLVMDADRVVLARILDGEAAVALPEGGGRRPAVEARVLEALKGKDPGPELRFVQHGHGVARYAAGEEVLLFLRRIDRTRELGALVGVVDWVSLQEHDAKYAVDARTRPALLGAVRAYVAAGSLRGTERTNALRAITVDLLTSGETRLASVALADLAMAPDAPLVAAEDVPRLEAVLSDSAVSMGVRVGLLAELERRRLVAGPPRWAALLDGARPAELPTVIRAAGAHPSPPVNARLVALLANEDPAIAAEAAMALGSTRDVAAVAPLEKALAEGEPRVRQASIRGLGQIPGAEARAALEKAAAANDDPSARRRAAAELRKRDAR